MSMALTLTGEVADALAAEAARRGESPDRVAADILAAGLLALRPPAPTRGGVQRTLAFAAIGESTTGISAVDRETMLADGFGRDDEL